MVFASVLPASAAGEGTILVLVNQARAANGLGPLKLNSAMSAVSTAWANQMGANGKMEHNPSFSSQIPCGWTKAAENAAWNYSSPTAVHNGWMNSAGHKANILGDYTDIGIAFVTVNGETWAVENFGKYGASVPAPAPPAPPPAPPAPPPPPAPPAPPAAPVVPAPPVASPATPPAAQIKPGTPSNKPGTSESSGPTTAESKAGAEESDASTSATPQSAARSSNSDAADVHFLPPRAAASTKSPTLFGLPLGITMAVALGFLIAASGAWTTVRLRRRWRM